MSNNGATTNVSVGEWNVCYNANDGIVALTCVVTSTQADISGAGLMLNDSHGSTLVSNYFEFSDSESVSMALNVPLGNLNVGDIVFGVASGEAGGQHFFFEDKLTIADC